MQGRADTDPVADALAGLLAGSTISTVLDVGGGSGTRAVPLALAGCRVTVLDASIDALAILRRRAADAGVSHLVTALQGDAETAGSAVTAGSMDLVLCHGLLEVVEDPAEVMSALRTALAPTGIVSILTAGRYAAVVARVRAGRSDEARALLADRDGRYGPTDVLQRRYDEPALRDLVERSGMRVVELTGVGTVSGLLGNARHPSTEQTAGRLEQELSRHPVLKELATDLHLIARNTDGTGSETPVAGRAGGGPGRHRTAPGDVDAAPPSGQNETAPTAAD